MAGRRRNSKGRESGRIDLENCILCTEARAPFVLGSFECPCILWAHTRRENSIKRLFNLIWNRRLSSLQVHPEDTGNPRDGHGAPAHDSVV
jgi:hypothetical protein